MSQCKQKASKKKIIGDYLLNINVVLSGLTVLYWTDTVPMKALKFSEKWIELKLTQFSKYNLSLSRWKMKLQKNLEVVCCPDFFLSYLVFIMLSFILT